MVRSYSNNTYWRKFSKGIDLNDNLQITLTSLTSYSLSLEIQKRIPKPLERFLCLSFKNCHFMLHLHSRNHSECRILHQNVPRPPNKVRGFTLVHTGQSEFWGTCPIIFLYPKDYYLKYLISNHVCHSKYLKWKLLLYFPENNKEGLTQKN